jgi:hypothetical protein
MSLKEICVLQQMSTGDQTQYVRSKLAERGSQRGAQFMRDGFDVWAESDAPARYGQMEKEPAQEQMVSYGGAMTLKDAKNLRLDTSTFSDYSDRSKRGGADLIPPEIKKAVDEAKKLVEMWRKISAWIDSFEADLQDEIIDNPSSQASLVQFATQLKSMINNVKVFKDILDSVAKALESVGMGRRRLHGGFGWQDVGKHVANITKIYMWFKNNYPNLKQVLGLKSLQPYGQQVLDAITPIASAVGLGRGGACTPPKRHPKKFGTKCPPGQRDDGLACWEDAKCDMPRMTRSPMSRGPMSRGPMCRCDSTSPMGGRAPSARGVIVKQIMAEHGLSLPQASKYVKEHGLY